MLSLPFSNTGCARRRVSVTALAIVYAATVAAGRCPQCLPKGHFLPTTNNSNSITSAFLHTCSQRKRQFIGSPVSQQPRRGFSIAQEGQPSPGASHGSRLTASEICGENGTGRNNAEFRRGDVAPRFSGSKVETRQEVHHGKLASRQQVRQQWKTGALVGRDRQEAILGEQGEYRVYQDLLAGRMTRFVSRVMYDGTNYSGFQLQDGQHTIQEVLETNLSRRFQRYVPVMGAGRTDSGVHAMGQAIHFDLPKADTDLGELTYVMNQMMPEDIRVWNMSIAPPSTPEQAQKHLPFHVMCNAKGKVYSYRLCVADVPSPLGRLYRVHASRAARSPINVDLIYKVMPLFVGNHDFAGFCNDASKTSAQKWAGGFGEFNTRRQVYSADVVDEGGGNLKLVFHLDGALYRMVRNMVGAVLAVAAGRVGIETVDKILTTGIRDTSKIHCAPPHGLTLETVHFDGYE